MSIELTMPRLSDTMEVGTIIKWNVKEGDEVSAGDVVADIETDKATMEMQVYDDGVIARLLVEEGKTVEVGTTIAVLAEEDEDAGDVASSGATQASTASSHNGSAAAGSDESSSDTTSSSTATTVAEKPASIARSGQSAPDANGNGRIRISPVARQLADDHGLDIQGIQGSGPSGRIVKKDVLAVVEGGGGAPTQTPPAIEEPQSMSAPAPATVAAQQLEAQTIQLSGMRQTIAKRLVESKTTIPHYQVTSTINMDSLLDLRTTLNKQLADQGVKLSVNDFLVRACALAMHQHPQFNASWGGDRIQVHGHINVGVAVAIGEEKGGGLVVATIRDADQRGLRDISNLTKTLANKARTKGLTIDEMSDSTFTISNLGMFGVDHFTAIINPPNSAILAVGASIEKPVARDGQIVIGHEMSMTLSLDHRVIDGAMAAQYLQTVRKLLENPASLLV